MTTIAQKNDLAFCNPNTTFGLALFCLEMNGRALGANRIECFSSRSFVQMELLVSILGFLFLNFPGR